MGFSVGKKDKVISEINVTPLVDVMLVLLIIFMITAPLMFSGIDLKLPVTKEVSRVNLSTKQVILSFTKKGDLFIGSELVVRRNLLKKLKESMEEVKVKTLFLRADFSINYGQVADLMTYLKNGGITNIALVTEVKKK